MKRTALKRGRPRPRVPMAGFWAAVTDNGAAPCALAHLGGCEGHLDAHHYYPAQRIRRNATLAVEAVTDPRNGVPLCRFHHGQVEARRVECPRPAELAAFLADFDLHERVVA